MEAGRSLQLNTPGGRLPAVATESNVYAGINRLEELGGDVRFTVHGDMAHDVWVRAYVGEDLYRWLLQHKSAGG
ncbi:hypothetical protein [Microbulbifer sediminum]|uniref:hypothetical protein n=1 Tax=Microbulbifer sediminum TaxID=2904250 RepID=UPI001F21EA74|nr:hypothetical protein [Microbulbifer sediminum]